MIPRDDGPEEEKEYYSHYYTKSPNNDEEVTDLPLIPTVFPIPQTEEIDSDTETETMPGPSYPTESPWSGGPPPWWNHQSTLVTSPSISETTAHPDHVGSTESPIPISSNGPAPSATDDEGFAGSNGNEFEEKLKGNHGGVYAAAGIVPVALLIIAAVVFFCLRKRRRQRQAVNRNLQVQEMKRRDQSSVQPYIAPPPPPPPTQPQYIAPPSHPPPPRSPASPPPVILGPIGSGNNGAYFTGIDTSDVVSMNDRPNDRTGLGDPFADGNSLHEEPPPPYRPRSIAPLSRDTSLRAPETSSRTNLVETQSQPLRSPFADPSDDDAVSEMSAPAPRRNNDAMSMVSDLSYQQDPVVTRPAV